MQWFYFTCTKISCHLSFLAWTVVGFHVFSQRPLSPLALEFAPQFLSTDSFCSSVPSRDLLKLFRWNIRNCWYNLLEQSHWIKSSNRLAAINVVTHLLSSSWNGVITKYPDFGAIVSTPPFFFSFGSIKVLGPKYISWLCKKCPFTFTGWYSMSNSCVKLSLNWYRRKERQISLDEC